MFTMQPVCQRSNCIYNSMTIKKKNVISQYYRYLVSCLFGHLLYFSDLSQNSDKINQ